MAELGTFPAIDAAVLCVQLPSKAISRPKHSLNSGCPPCTFLLFLTECHFPYSCCPYLSSQTTTLLLRFCLEWFQSLSPLPFRIFRLKVQRRVIAVVLRGGGVML